MASLTKSLAIEWAPHGVCVNAIAPGVFRTPLNQTLLDGTERGREFLAAHADEAVRAASRSWPVRPCSSRPRPPASSPARCSSSTAGSWPAASTSNREPNPPARVARSPAAFSEGGPVPASPTHVASLPARWRSDRPLRWVICALLFFATTINYIDRQVVWPAQARRCRRSSAGPRSTTANIVFAFQLAYAIGLVVAGRVDGSARHEAGVHACHRVVERCGDRARRVAHAHNGPATAASLEISCGDRCAFVTLRYRCRLQHRALRARARRGGQLPGARSRRGRMVPEDRSARWPPASSTRARTSARC